jgi:hypothetical protein
LQALDFSKDMALTCIVAAGPASGNGRLRQAVAASTPPPKLGLDLLASLAKAEFFLPDMGLLTGLGAQAS